MTLQNWENSLFLTNNFFFFQLGGDEKNHNKFSTAILKFGDQTKWQDEHIKKCISKYI